MPPGAVPLGTSAADTRHKVHHAYIWLGTIRVVFSLLIAFLFYGLSLSIGNEASGNREGFLENLAILGIAVFFVFIIVVGIVFVFQFLSYRHLYYELGAEEFSLYSGILNKKRVHVPYQRVQSVNQRAKLIQRICGVCTVHIDTAGGSTNKAVIVPYLRNTDAEWLRSELFARKQYLIRVQQASAAAAKGSAVGGAASPVTAPAAAAAAAAVVSGAALGAYPGAAPAAYPQGYPGMPQGAYPPAYPGAAPAVYPGAPQGAYPQAYPAAYPGYPGYPGVAPGAYPGYAQAYPGAYPPVHPASQGSNILDAPAEIISDVRGFFGGMAYDTGAVSYEYGLSNKELFFTGLSNNTGFVVVVLAIMGTILGVVTQLLEIGFGEQAHVIYDQGLTFIDSLFAKSIVLGIIVVVVTTVLFVWAASVLGTLVSYGGFKACRRQHRIEVEHGLLQHRFHGVDIDRVQSVIIKQSLIRRLIGYGEISLGRIDAQAQNNQDNENVGLNQKGLIVHPFVKMSKVPEILAGLVPEFADMPTEAIKLPKRALRRALIRRCIWKGGGFWLAVMVAIVHIGLGLILREVFLETGEMPFNLGLFAGTLYAVCLLIAAIEATNAILWYRGSSFAYNEKFIQISNFGFSRESVSMPKKKIQFGYTRTNPFQRFSKVVTINVRTAAGIGGTTTSLLDANEEDAQALLDWLRPKEKEA